ncbi:THAP-type domain-containing protein, partial [Aphis craccivora]
LNQLNLLELLMKFLASLWERMNRHITYLYSLKTIDGVPLWKSQRITFIIGFATSIKSIISSILLHTSITLINGNCNLLTQDEEESTIKLLIDNISNNPFINTITDNVLYYTSGYIVKKLIPVLQCPNDIKALIYESNNINDHAYCQKNKKSFNNSTNIKIEEVFN